MYVLGIHCGHDSSASLICDGKIVAGCCEERLVRIKHYAGLPIKAAEFCLKKGGITMDRIDAVAFSSSITRPEAAFWLGLRGSSNNLRSSLAESSGFSNKIRALLLNIFQRAFLGIDLGVPSYVKTYNLEGKTVFNVEHHLAHAASAYYTAGFDGDGLVITADGAGDNISTAVWLAQNNSLLPLARFGREGSLGFAYGAVTEALGWVVGDGEGKTMGLAPYGDASKANGALDEIFPHYENGDLKTARRCLVFPSYWNERGVTHWHFGQCADYLRAVKERLGREDLVAEAQRILEEETLQFISAWIKRTGVKKLASAGGVFLNVKLNQSIIEQRLAQDYYVYPEASDGGTAAGAALYVFHKLTNAKPMARMPHLYWGPNYRPDEVRETLDSFGIKYEFHQDIEAKVAKLLSAGKIVGWFQGRMELGPRALGNRSILMDPRQAKNKDIINSRVKFREAFRPFCPSLIEDAASDYLGSAMNLPFMIISFAVVKGKEKNIPAVVHVDGTCRPQTVSKAINPRFYNLLNEFGRITGVPVLLNTSFNIKGEPIVCSPSDALRCFFTTGIDYLCMENYLISK